MSVGSLILHLRRRGLVLYCHKIKRISGHRVLPFQLLPATAVAPMNAIAIEEGSRRAMRLTEDRYGFVMQPVARAQLPRLILW